MTKKRQKRKQMKIKKRKEIEATHLSITLKTIITTTMMTMAMAMTDMTMTMTSTGTCHTTITSGTMDQRRTTGVCTVLEKLASLDASMPCLGVLDLIVGIMALRRDGRDGREQQDRRMMHHMKDQQ